MTSKRKQLLLHAVLITLVALTLLPFFFVVNNSLRTNAEMNHSYFGMPNAMDRAVAFTWHRLTGHPERIQLRVADESATETRRATEIPLTTLGYRDAMQRLCADST